MPYQKHLGILLDEKFNFEQHVDSDILKMNKGVSVIKKTSTKLTTKIITDYLQSPFRALD